MIFSLLKNKTVSKQPSKTSEQLCTLYRNVIDVIEIKFPCLQLVFITLKIRQLHELSPVNLYFTMSDKSHSPQIIPTQPTHQPLVKIGHYILGETLGVGTFGKVKSKDNCYVKCVFKTNSFFNSGKSSVDWPQSSSQDFESSENKKSRCSRENST